jgi:predicted dehydrogenase
VKPIRIAVVGAGHLGRIHARLLAGLPQFSLVAIVDPVEASRREASERYATRALAHHGELAGLVDAAIVATPTSAHAAIAADLLGLGIHLLVEKPLTPTLVQADHLVDLAHRSRVVLQVGHVERFNPLWTVALPHLDSPSLIEAARSGPFSFRSTDIGVVLDLMIHDIDLALSLVDSPLRRVEATGLALLGRHEDLANARLIFENGAVASLTASRLHPTPARTISIWSRGCLANLDLAARSGILTHTSEPLRRGQFNIEKLGPAEALEFKANFSQHLAVQHIEAPPADAITAELEDFARAIHTGSLPRVSGVQGRNAIAVAEDILARLKKSQPASSLPAQSPALPSIIPAPHWLMKPSAAAREHREAG